jgi:hypothetical protein
VTACCKPRPALRPPPPNVEKGECKVGGALLEDAVEETEGGVETQVAVEEAARAEVAPNNHR